MKSEKKFNLIDQAIYYLKKAQKTYNEIDKDTMEEDYIIRDCCLELQTTVEMFVKGLIEQLCGCNYLHEHAYYGNINILKANKQNIKKYDVLEKILDDLDEKADTITKWHTHSLYVTGFKTTLKQINDVKNIAERFKNYWEMINNSSSCSSTQIMSMYKYDLVDGNISLMKRDENISFWDERKKELENAIKNNTVLKNNNTQYIIKEYKTYKIIIAYNIGSMENAKKIIEK